MTLAKPRGSRNLIGTLTFQRYATERSSLSPDPSSSLGRGWAETKKINLFRLCRIIFVIIPQALCIFFSEKYYDKYEEEKEERENDEHGKRFFNDERFRSNLKPHEIEKIESGQTQNWDSSLFFRALLRSSHFLLADQIGQAYEISSDFIKATVRCNKNLTITVVDEAGKEFTISSDLMTDTEECNQTLTIKVDDHIFFDCRKNYTIAKVKNVSCNHQDIIIEFTKKLTLSRSYPIDTYVCSKEWDAVNKLNDIRNAFAHCSSTGISKDQLQNIVKDVQESYTQLKIHTHHLLGVLDAPILEAHVAEAEKFMKEAEVDKRFLEFIDGIKKGVHEIENNVKGHPELNLIAFFLRQNYYDLVADVQQSLIDHEVNIEVIKRMIKVYLKGETEDYLMQKKCIDLLEIQDFNSLFDFLIDNHFIGYLNYNLLKRISKRIPQDVSLKNQVNDYEKTYAKLLNKISCNDAIPLFKEWSHLYPNAPIGLPCISFRLSSPWPFQRFYTWVSTFGKFSWSEYAFLKQLRMNCVIVTYAILPCVLDDVMKDLENEEILKKLKDEGVTVHEMP
uniref:Uncharacterized protein n=1 Tax=Amphimedon queenslandica TaxID=400682 RepID=A0A1X7TLB4_AMPQE